MSSILKMPLFCETYKTIPQQTPSKEVHIWKLEHIHIPWKQVVITSQLLSPHQIRWVADRVSLVEWTINSKEYPSIVPHLLNHFDREDKTLFGFPSMQILKTLSPYKMIILIKSTTKILRYTAKEEFATLSWRLCGLESHTPISKTLLLRY